MPTNTSLPPRANLSAIIKDLFQNEKVKTESAKYYETFADVYLTDDQQKQLVYPQGFFPMNIFVLEQNDAYVGQNFSTYLSIASFVKNGDGYIYGYYFQVINQERFEIEDLVNSKQPIVLSPSAGFVSINYLEVYNNVLGTTMILSLGTPDIPYATLQYRQCNNYYYETLYNQGISDPTFPPIQLLGLSKSLIGYTEQHC